MAERSALRRANLLGCPSKHFCKAQFFWNFLVSFVNEATERLLKLADENNWSLAFGTYYSENCEIQKSVIFKLIQICKLGQIIRKLF